NKNNIKTAIDTLLMHQYHNLDTRKVPVLKECKLGLFIDKDIKKILYIMNPYLAKNLQKSYFHTLISIKWFFVPNGGKANLFPSYTILFDITSSLDNNYYYIKNNPTCLYNISNVSWSC